MPQATLFAEVAYYWNISEKRSQKIAEYATFASRSAINSLNLEPIETSPS